MTPPVPVPQPVPATSWPAVFEGIGALVVRCDLDPDALLDRIVAASAPHAVTWIAAKINGEDIADDAETAHAIARWRARGLTVGAWVWNFGPPQADVHDLSHWNMVAPGYPLPFVVYNVEQPYKADEGGHYEWASQLVSEHHLRVPTLSAAVTSYGAYKASLDFKAFASAGWPILAQVYDSFHDGDEQSYRAVYPGEGIHRLTRRLALTPGESVYRPESIG